MKFYHFYDPALGWIRCTTTHKCGITKEPHPSGIMSERTMKNRLGEGRWFYDENDKVVHIKLNTARELKVVPI